MTKQPRKYLMRLTKEEKDFIDDWRRHSKQHPIKKGDDDPFHVFRTIMKEERQIIKDSRNNFKRLKQNE